MREVANDNKENTEAETDWISVSRNRTLGNHFLSPLFVSQPNWEYSVQDSRETQAALREQLLDDPILLDFPRVFRRVQVGQVVVPRSLRPSHPHLIFNRGASAVVVLVGAGIRHRRAREVEIGRPHDSAVELVDRGSPRVRAECVRVARLGWAFAPTWWAGRLGAARTSWGPDWDKRARASRTTSLSRTPSDQCLGRRQRPPRSRRRTYGS
jgi:hypothetical protein